MNTNPDYEPKRDLWPTYEPWMRDLLTDDTRVSWEGGVREVREPWSALARWADWELDLADLRIHPEDCPDKPADPADPVEELAKVIHEADTTNFWHWNALGVFDIEHYLDMAQAAIAHIEEQS